MKCCDEEYFKVALLVKLATHVNVMQSISGIAWEENQKKMGDDSN